MDRLKKLFSFESFSKYGIPFITIGLIIFEIGINAKNADMLTQYSRMRVNRSASLTLSTSWQKIDFSGTSTGNTNTFPPDPAGSGNPLVWWDATNKIFRCYGNTDINYQAYFTGACTATLLTTPVTLRYRITVPGGGTGGTDLHFPNPDSDGGDGYSDLGPLSYVSYRPFDQSLPIYVNSAIRTNGFYIEVELSNGTLGTCTLNYSFFLIQATAPTN